MENLPNTRRDPVAALRDCEHALDDAEIALAFLAMVVVRLHLAERVTNAIAEIQEHDASSRWAKARAAVEAAHEARRRAGREENR